MKSSIAELEGGMRLVNEHLTKTTGSLAQLESELRSDESMCDDSMDSMNRALRLRQWTSLAHASHEQIRAAQRQLGKIMSETSQSAIMQSRLHVPPRSESCTSVAGSSLASYTNRTLDLLHRDHADIVDDDNNDNDDDAEGEENEHENVSLVRSRSTGRSTQVTHGGQKSVISQDYECNMSLIDFLKRESQPQPPPPAASLSTPAPASISPTSKNIVFASTSADNDDDAERRRRQQQQQRHAPSTAAVDSATASQDADDDHRNGTVLNDKQETRSYF